jgi:hypothetical protein
MVISPVTAEPTAERSTLLLVTAAPMNVPMRTAIVKPMTARWSVVAAAET